jgi:hypothetical protein
MKNKSQKYKHYEKAHLHGFFFEIACCMNDCFNYFCQFVFHSESQTKIKDV